MTETVSTPQLESILSRIRYRPGGYSAVEGTIAAAIIEDPDRFTRESIVQFSRRLAVSTGSAVRFAKLAGFSGFRELRLAVARETVPSLVPGIAPSDGLAHVLDEQIRAIAYASSAIDHALFSVAADALARARHIEMCGAGASAAIVQAMLFSLTAGGIRARFLPDPHEQAAAAGFCGTGDVLLAVSFSGRTRFVVDAAERARTGGASVIALTCSPRSPLGRMANIPLAFDARRAKLADSEWPWRAALYALGTALVREVAARIPRAEKTRRAGTWASGRFAIRYGDGNGQQPVISRHEKARADD